MEETGLLGRKHKAVEIVIKLRQLEVLTAQRRPVAEAVRSLGVTEVTYYHRGSEYVDLKGNQVKLFKVDCADLVYCES